MVDAHLYYSTVENQEKIAKECKYRMVQVIKFVEDKKVAIWPFKIFKPEHFAWIYGFLSLDKVPFGLYISNASLKLPKLPHNMKNFKSARYRLNRIWENIMTGYDWYVDIDAEKLDDEQELIGWAKEIQKDMPKGNTEIWSTGSGGIHIIQKGRFRPDFVADTVRRICIDHDIPLRSKQKERPYVDDSIYTLKRIRRVPYSLHNRTDRPMELVGKYRS